jgi:hypothetical protein
MIRIEPKEPYKGLKRTPMKQKPPKVSWLTKNPPDHAFEVCGNIYENPELLISK